MGTKTILVHRSWLETPGLLPPICLKTGLATNGEAEQRSVVAGGQADAVSILTAPVLGYYWVNPGERVLLHLPRTDANVSRRRRWAAIGIAFMAGIPLVSLVLAVVARSLLFVWVALGFALAGTLIALWSNSANGLEASVNYHSGVVQLGLVHPTAAEVILTHIEKSASPSNRPLPPPLAPSGLPTPQ
jgi:hypothetical protein